MSDKLLEGMWSVTLIGAEAPCASCHESNSPTIIIARQKIFRSSITPVSNTVRSKGLAPTRTDAKLSARVWPEQSTCHFDRMGESFGEFSILARCAGLRLRLAFTA